LWFLHRQTGRNGRRAVAGDDDRSGNGAQAARRGLNLPEIAVALALAGLGLFITIHGSTYPMGRLARMGTGFVPWWLGAFLIGLGLLIAVQNFLAPRDAAPSLSWRAGFVLAGLLAWALLVDRAGLVPATVALVFIASLAEPRAGILRPLITSAVLCVVGVAIFVTGLRVPFVPFRW
jgi:hypothetical protein